MAPVTNMRYVLNGNNLPFVAQIWWSGLGQVCSRGVPHSIIRNGLDPDRDLNAFTHVYLSWWTLKFQFGQHSKITWDTPNYALGPWHSLVQICATVDMCQRNIGSLTRPLVPPTCISAHCLGLLWLCACETSVTPFFFAHCVNLCHQLEPGLVGQRQDTRLTNATVFPRKFWYYSESRTAECLEGRDNASKFGLALPRPALILDLLCKEKEKPCALTMRVNAWQEITVHHNVF